ncbi:thioredoxin family protein [Persephonella sp.]
MNVEKVVIELLHLRGCPDCAEMIEMVKEIIEDLSDLSDKIELKLLDIFENNQRVVELGMYKCPALAVNGTLQYVGAVPMKNELKSLILFELSKVSG